MAPESLGAVTAISVIEHGIPENGLSPSSSRSQTRRAVSLFYGLLAGENDTSDTQLFGLPWTIFDSSEIRTLIERARGYGLAPVTEPADLNAVPVDRPIHFAGRSYTFLYGVLVKTQVSAPPTSLRTRTTCRSAAPASLPLCSTSASRRSPGPSRRRGKPLPVQRAVPLELVRCDMTRDQDACGLVQTRHTVPGSILYQNYWYRSGVNQTMTGTCTRSLVEPSSSPACRRATWSWISAVTTARCSTGTSVATSAF